MAKDPAFLFYPGDYIGGTMHLDFQCKGAYMDLLMLQFNRGHMTLHMIKQVLGDMYEHIWPQVKDKFCEKDGLFWNERLRIEKEKRLKFCKSRKDNKYKDKHMTHHMSLHMENENENRILNKSDREDFLTNQLWKEQFCMAKNISMKDLEEMQTDWLINIDLKNEVVDNYKRYFTNQFLKRHEVPKVIRSGPKKIYL